MKDKTITEEKACLAKSTFKSWFHRILELFFILILAGLVIYKIGIYIAMEVALSNLSKAKAVSDANMAIRKGDLTLLFAVKRLVGVPENFRDKYPLIFRTRDLSDTMPYLYLYMNSEQQDLLGKTELEYARIYNKIICTEIERIDRCRNCQQPVTSKNSSVKKTKDASMK